MKDSPRVALLKADIRKAFAEYKYSEGCSCCRNDEMHNVALSRLAKLLGIPPYKDGRGYDVYQFLSKK